MGVQDHNSSTQEFEASLGYEVLDASLSYIGKPCVREKKKFFFLPPKGSWQEPAASGMRRSHVI
jgi:hypothetical protein